MTDFVQGKLILDGPGLDSFQRINFVRFRVLLVHPYAKITVCEGGAFRLYQ